MLAVEKVLKSFEQRRDRALERQIQRHHDPLQQLVAAARRIRDQPDRRLLGIELAQQMPHERRFARTDFTGDDGELGVVEHAELEHGKRHAVRAAPINEIRIRQDRKRLFPKPVIRLVHQWSSINAIGAHRNSTFAAHCAQLNLPQPMICPNK